MDELIKSHDRKMSLLGTIIPKMYEKSCEVSCENRNNQPINFWSAEIRSRSACSLCVVSVISVIVI
jgi:hypothetical protein